MTFRLLLFGAISTLLASTSFADVTETGAGGDIADNGTTVSTITITDDEVIEDAHFCIEGLEHEWVGDLVVTVTHVESNTTATLFNRVGRFPTSGPGDSSNLGGTYVFEDGGADLWTEAASQPNTGALAGGTYSASDVGGNPISLDGLFAGQSTAGTWRISISDELVREVGSFASWSVEFGSTAAVPEPGTAAGLGLLALVGGTFYRRRKQS